ncbi:MAG: hypothetical protein AAGI48_10900 [Verrucomicrobiota bacterium]
MNGVARNRRAFRTWVVVVIWSLLVASLLKASEKGRPIPEGGGPTEIQCAIGVLDLDEISDANQNFTANVFVLMTWDDPREAHDLDGPVRRKLENVWHPGVILLNRQRLWSSLGSTVSVTPEGSVSYRQQLWGDFSQPMKLRDFPFDVQEFDIPLVSAGTENRQDLRFVANRRVKSWVTENYSVADWKITGFSIDETPIDFEEGLEIPAFTLRFTAERLSTHYMIKVIAPLLMIVLLSWVVFWLNPSEGGSQLGVAVTSFLTVIAYHVALSSRLPEISYLTRLDIFVFCGTVLVFLAMIEVVITTGLAQSGRIVAARWLDRICRVLFPVLLALGSCFAFLWG